jgi:hypothetical protein
MISVSSLRRICDRQYPKEPQVFGRSCRVQAAGSKCYSPHVTLDDIQQAIAKLSPEERAKLRLWLAEYEAGKVEREPETKASKFGRLAGRAVADFRKRLRGP